MLDVSTGGYAEWKKCGGPTHWLSDEQLLALIRAVHAEYRQAYGSPRITAELKSCGIPASLERVKRLMRENGIRAKHKRRYKATTASKHVLPMALNLLDRQFDVSSPGWMQAHRSRQAKWCFSSKAKSLSSCRQQVMKTPSSSWDRPCRTRIRCTPACTRSTPRRKRLRRANAALPSWVVNCKRRETGARRQGRFRYFDRASSVCKAIGFMQPWRFIRISDRGRRV